MAGRRVRRVVRRRGVSCILAGRICFEGGFWWKSLEVRLVDLDKMDCVYLFLSAEYEGKGTVYL